MPIHRNVFDFLDQNGAFWCILRTVFLPRDESATYRHSAVYARVWCLFVCLSVTRSQCFINAAERIITPSTES